MSAFHHHKNFEGVKSFVLSLESKASDVKALKDLVLDSELEERFREIQIFEQLPIFIDNLESRSISMGEQLSIVDTLRESL